MSTTAPSPIPILVVLSGPSGSGKTTLCTSFIRRHPDFSRAITCTTRSPRQGERNGVDYYFLQPQDFIHHIQSGDFLENAEVYNQAYGTLRKEVIGKLHAGKNVLLTVDVQGAESIRRLCDENRPRGEGDPPQSGRETGTLRHEIDELSRAVVSIFMVPPTLRELKNRLRKRNLDSLRTIDQRLQQVTHEIEQYRNFDYLLESGTEQHDLKVLESIVEAERRRIERCALPFRM